MAHPRLTLAFAALILASGSAHAGSWLTGPSAYEQAVQAVAAARWEEAENLLAAAAPGQGRVKWLQRLLRERRIGERISGHRIFQGSGDRKLLDSRGAITHSYAYHNLFLFLRAEGMPGELVQEALERALGVYELWIGTETQVQEGLRWAYAALLHEADQAAEAGAFLDRTKGDLGPWGAQGPQKADVGKFGLGFQMLLAYFHTARGDHDLALDYLRAARVGQEDYVRTWATTSDDFWAMRDDPRFQRLFELD